MGQKYRKVNDPRKLIHTSRKTMKLSTCQPPGVGLLFPPRRRGNPTTAANTAGNRRIGRTGGPACRQEGQPEVCGKLQAEGSVGAPDGDPSGSSSGRRPRQIERFATADREVGHRQIERSARWPGRETDASDSQESHRSRTCFNCGPGRSWVPGPTPNGLRTPRGLMLRQRLPRGFSRLDCFIVRGDDPPLTPRLPEVFRL